MFKSMIIAISMYSRIPMPKVDWNEKSTKYAIYFYPLVGVIIGLLQIGLWFTLPYMKNNILFSLFLCLIPLIVDGGIHLDGFMDTSDALHSYGDFEKRNKILDDPHIGAFSVIKLLLFVSLYFGGTYFYFQEATLQKVILFAGIALISRVLVVMVAVSTKKSKEGLLSSLTHASFGGFIALLIIFLLWSSIILFLGFRPFVVVGVIICILYAIYLRRSFIKNFGGISGDLTGFLLCRLQLLAIYLYLEVNIFETYFIW